MADIASDAPLSHAPAAHNRDQRTHSGTQSHQKRNNRNRRNHNNNNNNATTNGQLDGAVSDGAVAMNISTPQSKRSQKQRQQSMNMGARPIPQHGPAGAQPPQNVRPVSVGAGIPPDTPGKDFEQAYAGPTFSNSPAASALPVPKFFSKSVPNVARPPSTHTRPAGERLPAERPSPPESDDASPVPAPEPPQSPLDLFFKADRAEKEMSMNFNLSKSLSPNTARASPLTNSRNAAQQSGKSGKSIFLSELDGDDTDVPSPRTRPQQGRPPAGERANSSPNVIFQTPQTDDQRQANTRSLKELLWSTAANASMTPPQSRSRGDSGSRTPDGIFGPPSPFNASGPSTPQPSSEQQNHYSLHYGNRNLSPLFKASRTDTPPRPSSLRQELPSNHAPGSFPTPHSTSSVDPNLFARTYLNDQIRAHAPAEMPQFPFASAPPPKPVHPPGHTPGTTTASKPIPVQQSAAARPQHGIPSPASAPSSSTSTTTTPRTGAGTRDVQSMENDLRRMLKLNV